MDGINFRNERETDRWSNGYSLTIIHSFSSPVAKNGQQVSNLLLLLFMAMG
jgi:hypothetical protein